jgi:hypothetical protein
MVSEEPEDAWCVKAYEPPDWLWKKPFNSFIEYAMAVNVAQQTFVDLWFNKVSPFNQINGSLYDTHTAALKGDKMALKAMRVFIVAITTAKLTR